MGSATADYLEAIDRLPEGSTLIVHHVAWDDYERLLEELADRPALRLSYDRGRLDVMTPLPEHEEYASFVEDVVRVLADVLRVNLEKRGRATWKRRSLGKGVEPDACYFVASADRVVGKRQLDLESDPAPDIAVEIDVTNESLTKFPIYAALGVAELWRYDGQNAWFYQLAGNEYRETLQSRFVDGFTATMLAEVIEQSKTQGQTAALRAFRARWEKR
jgi:Uma2 family endonuclease